MSEKTQTDSWSDGQLDAAIRSVALRTARLGQQYATDEAELKQSIRIALIDKSMTILDPVAGIPGLRRGFDALSLDNRRAVDTLQFELHIMEEELQNQRRARGQLSESCREKHAMVETYRKKHADGADAAFTAAVDNALIRSATPQSASLLGRLRLALGQTATRNMLVAQDSAAGQVRQFLRATGSSESTREGFLSRLMNRRGRLEKDLDKLVSESSGVSLKSLFDVSETTQRNLDRMTNDLASVSRRMSETGERVKDLEARVKATRAQLTARTSMQQHYAMVRQSISALVDTAIGNILNPSPDRQLEGENALRQALGADFRSGWPERIVELRQVAGRFDASRRDGVLLEGARLERLETHDVKRTMRAA